MRRCPINILLTVVAVVVTVASLASCGIEEDYAAQQRKQIENYLTGKSLDYRITADSAYVHLAGNSLASPEEVYAAKGDSVIFNVAAYAFTSQPATTPYYTNKKWLADELSATLDTRYWDFNPIRHKIGDGDIIKGLDSALPTYRAGDSLAVFLTSSIAYGATGTGVVPKDTALMMVITILEVKK